MNKSNDVGKLMGALSAAQGQIANAAKDSANPFFKSSYADLASVWGACRGPLATNGLAVVQIPRATGKSITVETVLGHSSGEWISDELTTEAKDSSPQSVGSAITYLRRYALSAMVGVAPSDDDSESAQGRPAPAPYIRAPAAVVAAAVAHVAKVTAPVPPPYAVPTRGEQRPPVEPPHDEVTGEVVDPKMPGDETICDKFVLRFQAATSIRPGLTEIAADIREASGRGLINDSEREFLLSQYRQHSTRLTGGK